MQASTTTDQTDITDTVWLFVIWNSSFSKHPRHPRYPWFLDLTIQRFNILTAAKPFVCIRRYFSLRYLCGFNCACA